MRIALAQVQASPNKQENLAKARAFIEKACLRQADLIVFPEVFMAFVGGVAGNYTQIAESIEGPFVTALAEMAKSHALHIICGIHETHPSDTRRVYNSIVFLDDGGELIHHYRKTHLYDAFSFTESRHFVAADNGFVPVKTRFGTLGLLVCYELRFPEIARTLALKGAEILIVPTAWVHGVMKEEHLSTLAKARALENTTFVCVADQVGNIYSGRSAIYNPMGVVMAACGEEEGLIFADIDVEDIGKIREKLPLLQQRRHDLYELG